MNHIKIPRPLYIGEILVIEDCYPGVRRRYTQTPDSIAYAPGLEKRAKAVAELMQALNGRLKYRLSIYKRVKP